MENLSNDKRKIRRLFSEALIQFQELEAKTGSYNFISDREGVLVIELFSQAQPTELDSPFSIFVRIDEEFREWEIIL